MVRLAPLLFATLTATAAAEDLNGFPAFAAFLAAERAGAKADLEAAGARPVTFKDETRGSGGGFASHLRTIRAGDEILLEAATWDRTGPVRLDRFFDGGAARDEALAAISAHLRALMEREFGTAPEFGPRMQATAPDVAVLSNFTLMEEGAGLAFHFAPGEVAPKDAGPVEARVPTARFAPHLNEEGRALFR
ncbi:MAG: RsiV family protein [Pikeienuella sp.]|uniref:RsiV family protein n=1 Tax=Pikeienuella sp. TaxID=2831957 RepID=UPI00391BB5A6